MALATNSIVNVILSTESLNPSIKLLSFDLDDTLWPCKPTILAAEQQLYNWMQQHVAVITERYDIDSLKQQRVQFMQQHPELSHDLSRVRRASLQALSQQFNLDNDWVELAFDVYYEARQQVTLYEDVSPVLDALKPHYRLVAVTNGNASVEKTGVGHWFEFAVSAANVGCQKPDPAFFEAVFEATGLSAEEILHIGDDPHRDIFGAWQLGIRTVWLNREGQNWTHNACRADQEIRSLEELPAILEELDA